MTKEREVRSEQRSRRNKEDMSGFDLIVRNGTVFDGSGAPGTEGDVGIKGERIAFVGRVEQEDARMVIDASGKIIVPGFIDVHSHSDFSLLANPGGESKILQGVTTELLGQCGASGAPLEGAVRQRRQEELNDLGIVITWRSFEEYLDRLEEASPNVNLACLVGHGNLRGGTVGYENRPASRDERECMARWLRESLEKGAYGLSSGLIYPPGAYASTAELMELAAIVADFQGMYATHLRSEGDAIEDAIDEAIAIAEGQGVSLQISHLKTHGKENWGKLPAVFQKIEAARSRGVEVHADRYPYIASSTDLDVVLPSWAWEGGHEAEMARLADPVTRGRIRNEILALSRDPDFWDKVMVISVRTAQNRKWEGKTIAEIGTFTGRDPVDALFRLLTDEELKVGAVFFLMSEENLLKIMGKGYVMVGTDSSTRSFSGVTRRGVPHPRGFGTYPRVLRQLTGSGKLLTWEESIHKMTGLPARKIGLSDRGLIRPGYFADLVVIDPVKVRDRAEYQDPYQAPEGIDYVMVNGAVAVERGAATKKRAGKVLRKQGHKRKDA